MQVDVPSKGSWGVNLYGSMKIDFGLPAKIVNFISSRGWGKAIFGVPYIGDVSYLAIIMYIEHKSNKIALKRDSGSMYKIECI